MINPSGKHVSLHKIIINVPFKSLLVSGLRGGCSSSSSSSYYYKFFQDCLGWIQLMNVHLYLLFQGEQVITWDNNCQSDSGAFVEELPLVSQPTKVEKG